MFRAWLLDSHDVPDLLLTRYSHDRDCLSVFFWAPTMKWGLVFASLSDMSRPVKDVSVPQCSGALWLSRMEHFRSRIYVIEDNWTKLR